MYANAQKWCDKVFSPQCLISVFDGADVHAKKKICFQSIDYLRPKQAPAGSAFRQQTSIPIRVRSIDNQFAVKVWLTICPPDRSPFAKRSLCLVDQCACDLLGICVTGLQGSTDLPAGQHELINQFLPQVFGKMWITHSPETPRYDEISTVRRNRILLLFHGISQAFCRTTVFSSCLSRIDSGVKAGCFRNLDRSGSL